MKAISSLWLIVSLVVLPCTLNMENGWCCLFIMCNVVASFLLSFASILLVRNGFGMDANKIIIGNIMLLIPGVALTNSLRDVVSGDTMSGLLRFLEAVILAMAIAAGYILASFVMGGVAL